MRRGLLRPCDRADFSRKNVGYAFACELPSDCAEAVDTKRTVSAERPQKRQGERQGELNQVVSLNEAAKVLSRCSFEINLRALDAIVQSKRSGRRLRGFDEVSTQMRTWSRELVQQLDELRALSCEALGLASLFIRQRRMTGLMTSALASSAFPGASAMQATVSATLEGRQADLKILWRRIIAAVEGLNLQGMMACVLSRSALIEATSSPDAEQRVQLGHVSQDFYKKSDEVVEIVRALAKEIGSSR